MMSLTPCTMAWTRALHQLDGQDVEGAIRIFQTIPQTSKIAFNLGMLHAAQNRRQEALEMFRKAVKLDPFDAIAHFQTGVLLFNLEDFDAAVLSFSKAMLLLGRSAQMDYRGVGLDFALSACEIRFNSAVCMLHLGRFEDAIEMLSRGTKAVTTNVFELADDTVADYWRVFTVPPGVLYRPGRKGPDLSC